MMRHQIRINVANRSGETRQVVQGRTLRLPRRLMRFLFGDFCEVLVLTPGRTVCGVEIHEVRPESEVS